MSDEEVKIEAEGAAPAAETPAPVVEPAAEEKKAEEKKPEQARPEQKREPRPERGERPQGGGGRDRGPRPGGGGGDRGERKPGGGDRPHGDRPRGDRPGGDRREGGRPGGSRPFEMQEIEIEKLIADSLYLDNQAHVVVSRMRDMDSGTKSQLRRLYNAVRRAVRAPENERQHQFVMLRARLAYTIARHSLRSLDALERLLLQVTRKNDPRGYERFKDLFEAIVAYNE